MLILSSKNFLHDVRLTAQRKVRKLYKLALLINILVGFVLSSWKFLVKRYLLSLMFKLI